MDELEVEAVDDVDSIAEQLRAVADDVERIEDEGISAHMAGIVVVHGCGDEGCEDEHFVPAGLHLTSDTLDDMGFQETLGVVKAFNRALSGTSFEVGTRDVLDEPSMPTGMEPIRDPF